MVTKYFMTVLVCGVWMTSQAFGQTTKILPWGNGDLTETGKCVNAYHPEPIILIHGCSSSRATWEDVINYLHYTNQWFQAYHYVSEQFELAKESTTPPDEDYTESELPADERNQWRDIEKPYIHTWNYGRHAKIGPLPYFHHSIRPQISRQSNDPIEWNSWAVPV